MGTRIVHDSYEDDSYRESPYTQWLTDHTPVWAWGAFTYPNVSVFAPLGTLGERRDLVAGIIYRELETKGW